MNLDDTPLLPTGLSDETAAALCDFLQELAAAADSRYLHQLRRYRSLNAPPVNPNQPWLFDPDCF